MRFEKAFTQRIFLITVAIAAFDALSIACVADPDLASSGPGDSDGGSSDALSDSTASDANADAVADAPASQSCDLTKPFGTPVPIPNVNDLPWR
jgi:hypothetical protein